MDDIYWKRSTITVAFQRMFGILERWNNNQVTPSISKLHELSYRSNTFHQKCLNENFYTLFKQTILHDYVFFQKTH